MYSPRLVHAKVHVLAEPNLAEAMQYSCFKVNSDAANSTSSVITCIEICYRKLAGIAMQV